MLNWCQGPGVWSVASSSKLRQRPNPTIVRLYKKHADSFHVNSTSDQQTQSILAINDFKQTGTQAKKRRQTKKLCG